MKRLRSESGSALLLALMLSASLLPVAVMVLLLARLDWLVVQNLRRQVEALTAAENGLEVTIGGLPSVLRPEDLMRGPDRQTGTADDGTLPLSHSVAAGHTVDVRVEQLEAPLLRLRSNATATNGGRQSVEALLAPEVLPFTPAAWFDVAAAVRLGCTANGGDHRLGDPIGAPAGRHPAVADHALAGAALASRVPVRDVLRALDRAPHAELAQSGHLGSSDEPVVTYSTQAWTIRDALSGAGVLVVRQPLVVAAAVRFDGFVVVEADIFVAAEGSLEIRGALWRTAGRLVCDGPGKVGYSTAGLTLAERSAPDSLPHALRMTAWRQPF